MDAGALTMTLGSSQTLSSRRTLGVKPVRGKYRDVILPMTVIRRLDAVLEPTKDAVLSMRTQLDAAGITNQDQALRQASGEAFHNTSPFRLRDLTSRGR